MIDGVLRLAEALRRNDIDVSASEVVDGVTALNALAGGELTDPALVRGVLRACLMKQPDDGLFDQCFRQAFSSSSADAKEDPPQVTPTVGAATSAPAMTGAVLDALLAGDEATIAAIAMRAVELLAGLDEGDGSERYFMHRLLRALDLSSMLTAAMRRLRSAGDLDELELMVRRNELAARLGAFRRLLAVEVARRLAQRDGLSWASERLAPTRPEDLDLTALSRADHANVRRALQPMIRRLAVRVGLRRKLRSTGRVDIRRTMRRSLQSGGVPIDVVNRRRHPHRPDLVVLCDVSGSVAEFAQFTFTLVGALHSEVRAARSFAFVDGVAEVTDVFRTANYDIAVNRLVERRGVVGLDGHSDYGRVFSEFAAAHLGEAVGPRTSLIICGDARSNYRDGNVEAFSAICRHARRVHWLNPERRSQWGRDDSLIDSYAPWCRSVHEVRSLRQLADAIAELS